MASDSPPDLPGTTLSPFDPTPPDSTDPFSSTGPWAGPPRTWQHLEAADDGREEALALGQFHGKLMDRLRALAEANGGGLAGLFVGMLHRLEAAHLLTAEDRGRQEALGDHLRTTSLSDDQYDQQAAFDRFKELHDAIVYDPSSKPLALAMAAVAMDSISRVSTTDDATFQQGYAAAFADLAGIGLGGFAGPIGSVVLGTEASTLAGGL